MCVFNITVWHLIQHSKGKAEEYVLEYVKEIMYKRRTPNCSQKNLKIIYC
jgi:hypothetical protein